MSDLSTYLDYGSTEISDDLNPERARQPEKQEPSNERKKMLADSLSTALEYGRRLAVEEGLYPHEGDWMHADIPDNDIILGANDWLLDQTGFTYDEFVDGMESTGLSDAVEWAWSLQGEPTVQLDVAHMARQGNPWQFVWDVGSNALGAAGSLLAGDLGGARDAWTEKDGHMYGYASNPYGSQVGNALGVHNWTDAGFALLDLADIASFGMGGMVIAPIRQAAANAQTRLGNHEIARVMGGKRMREELAEQAARTDEFLGPLVVNADDLHPYGNTPAWIDAAGNEGPVILHGTSNLNPIEGFEVGSKRRGWGSEGGVGANAGLRGVYGTTSPEMAQIYVGSSSAIGGPGGRVYNLTFEGTPRILDLTAGKPMPSDVRELLETKMRLDPDPSFRTDEMRAMLSDETTPLLDFLQILPNREALEAAGWVPARDTFEAKAVREAIAELYDVAKTTPFTPAGDASGLKRFTDEESTEWIFLNPEDVRVARSTIDPARSETWRLQPESKQALEAQDAARARVTEAQADTEMRTIWDNISTGEREVIEADYRAAFPDADPDPADMMRWYEQQGPPGTPPAKDMEDVADQLLDVVAGDSFTAAQNRIRFLVTEIDEALWNPSGSFTDEQIQKIVDLKQLLLDEGGRFPPRWQKKVTFDDDIFDPPDTFRFSDEYHNNISGITAAQREAYAEWRNELGIPELREGPPGTPRLGDVQGFPTALTPEEQTQDLFKLGSEDWARISDRLSPTERGQVADAYLAIHGGLGNEADMLQWYEMQRAAGFSQAEAAAIAEGPPGTPQKRITDALMDEGPGPGPMDPFDYHYNLAEASGWTPPGDQTLDEWLESLDWLRQPPYDKGPGRFNPDMYPAFREIREWAEKEIDRLGGPPGTPEAHPLDRRPGPEQRRPYPDTFTPDEIDQIVRNEGGLTDEELKRLMEGE